MKLLDVNAVLDRETHIQQADPECEVLKEDNSKSTRYAILSHRWSDEVGYEEMTGLMKMEEHKRDKVRQRSGYQKIIKSCKQAVKDRHEWLWIDTCCIDKRSSSELSEAINSMYQWYQNAQVCYAYLSDVDELPRPTMPYHLRSICRPNGWLGPEWFTRGWTLQELIAPRELEFFNKDWAPIGNKRHLAAVLQDITGIPREVLRDGLGAKPLSVAQIMSWAAGRKTQRVEDRAYSLMGLFGVNMPMLYGEGEKAFQRLQLEIIRTSSDQSIFAWNRRKPRTGSVLADDPSDFAGCGRIEKVEPDEFVDKLTKYIEWNVLGPTLYFRSNSRKISTNPIHWCRLAWLRWRARVVSQQHHLSFSVSNAGIQVCLPVIPLPDSRNHFRAILPCGRHFGLETIDLVFSGSRYLRTSAASSPILESPILKTYPEFKTLCLTHHQDANQTHREFTLDDKHASYHHFTRRGTYPREFTGNTVSLSSLIDDLVVIVYANDDAGFRFAVGLGYYHGQGWVHVVCDKPAIQKDWTSFAPEAYHRMWDARVEHAQRMFKQDPVHGRCACVHFIKHAHLPQSIWAARVVWSRWEKGDFTIMVDVEQCPGCCDGPHGWTATLNHYHGPQMPGLMYICSHPYSLRLDGWEVELDESSDQRIALGDYGDYSNGTFMRVGNIFEDAGILSIDTMGSTYCPVVPHVSSFLSLMSRHHTENEDDLVVAYHSGRKHLALRQPKVFSLPANDHLVRLLKALATRLAGKHLVLTVVQCSEFYGVDDNGERRDSVDDSNNHPAEGDISTPLCIIASPQVWRREMPCVQRREQFKSIREHFYALVNTRQPTGTDARHKAAVR
ncbi:heterokaryon incompatibility protein-domain-containing protein [Pisolithus orientalis]|uniref:heterokaryon incompatibility protein-domain-containing protein n=1 Tax=Pisolithus orientalis TaxID=936130 RepID=UPI002223F279|nr:heterokaryon incompatibility protein-domain-containing protein [Pisolithus orientalis]KAI5993801.1 heterokaryon incompatibility protein-domain-containing protein [Pisolithus orientalis]